MRRVDTYIGAVLLHIVLGFLLYFLGEPASKALFVITVIYFIGRITMSKKSAKTREVLLACAYFTGAEVLFRMTKGGISYEASKYLVILFVILGMFYKGLSGKGYPYFFYLVALVPGIIIASMTLSYTANFRTNIAFVLSGPVCLGIAALFCYDRKITHNEVLKILLYIALPSIAMTTYLFLYNPSIKATLSGTASNVATSGGFGPNQVSTALGLGMFVMIVRIFMKSPSFSLKLLNIVLLAAMTFRAIVTFSRGGVIAALIVVVAFLFTLYYRSSMKQRGKIIGSTLLFVIAIMTAWIISSSQTGGLIDKRYANQSSKGIEKKDLTTGRLDLFMEEVDGFLRSPFWGIGASKIKNIRVEQSGAHLPSHNEIGRLLSEHGFLGIIILLILIIKPLTYRANNKRNYFFYAFICFWFATINHSGMRIAAPSFLYALSLLNVTHEKYPVHRKQLKK